MSKEEAIKKYGQKAKDGVLIFEGKSTFVKEDVNTIKNQSEDGIYGRSVPTSHVLDKKESPNMCGGSC